MIVEQKNWVDLLPEVLKKIEEDSAISSMDQWNQTYLSPTSLARKENNANNKQKHINLTGLTDSQKAYVVAALSYRYEKSPVVLVADPLKARRLQQSLQVFLTGEVFIYHAKEWHLASVDAASREVELERLGIANRLVQKDFGAIIIVASALLQPLMTKQEFIHSTLIFKLGRNYQRETILKKLTDLGYERAVQVETKGQFAVRGDIIDIFPPGYEDPVRISLFDDEIDQIKIFNLNNQRSIENLKNITIPCAREWIILETEQNKLADAIEKAGEKGKKEALKRGLDSKTAEKIVQHTQADSDRVRNGFSFIGIEKWLPLLQRSKANILEYIDGTRDILFLDEPLSFRSRLDSSYSDFNISFNHLLDKGQILPLAIDSAFKSIEVFKKIDTWMPTIALINLPSSGNGLPGGEQYSLSGRESPRFRGQEEALFEVIQQRNQKQQMTLLMAGTKARQGRLQEVLENKALKVPVIDQVLLDGFEYPKANLFLIGVQDIFGIDQPLRKKKRRGAPIDLFSDLVLGQYVVHEQHGVGRYDGIVNLETDKIKRDYLKITYDGEDSLYIPVENLDQIQKYVATEGQKIKLSRLGGKDWSKLKDKARASIKQLAFDLVALYAKRQSIAGYAFSPDTPWQQEFEEDFPFEETSDQITAIEEIKKDMESSKVMDRLLCGDVGFGKTEVAFRAIFKAIMDGKQALLLSPTTVLAQQHYDNLKERLTQFPVSIGLLSRFSTPKEIKKNLHQLETGEIDVVVGTHRLLSKDVNPKHLGLLVVDEEQRFGVEHKEKIKNFRLGLDVLTLSATPIPRTLHMSLAGIRDISLLEDPPLDRRPVETYVMEYDEELVIEACLKEISRQGQIFYLFNNTMHIREKAESLAKAMPGARVVYAHGKMGEHQLEDIIESFLNHEGDILVCTTIIESGINMPNVNTIIVENGDRFGLSQLYQLKGRVGRSDKQAFAYITYQKNKVLTEVAQKRLTAIRDFTELGSGIKIALKDLEVRGAGNLLGAEQHGQMEAIGYDLYCKILDEELKILQGQAVEEEKIHTSVEIKIDAYIPEEYIQDHGLRMETYRRIAAISSWQDYQDVLDELGDRYGDLPSQVDILLQIAYIRQSSQKLGFDKILVKDKSVYFYYADIQKVNQLPLAKLMGCKEFEGRILISTAKKPFIQYNCGNLSQKEIVRKMQFICQTMVEEQ